MYIHGEPHAELAGDVQREHSCIPLGGFGVLMAYKRLDHLLRHQVLHEVHRERVPERFRRHRPDGKRHTVTRRHRLAYPAARRVLTLDVLEPRTRRQACRRKPLPQTLYESRIGERHRARWVFRISASVSRSACCSSFVGRPRRRLRTLKLSLLERAQHHEQGRQRCAGQRIVQRKVLPRKRQYFIEPACGVPQRIDEQALAEIEHPGQQDGHLGRQQVARHVGAVGGCQVSQRQRALVVKIACGARSGQIMTTGVAV